MRFHAAMALLIAEFMVVGFGYEFPRYVTHPNAHRPWLLAVHSAVFVGWMTLYVVQTLLIQGRKLRWHRSLGLFGLALAIVMPPLGIATALVMRRFDLATFPQTDPPADLAFLATTFADIIAFTPCAWLGIAWRKRPEHHRRLMYLATASIAEAGFGRLPIPGMRVWFFLGNFVLFGAAVIHDRVRLGHVHRVLCVAVPLIMLDEIAALYLWQAHPHWWLAACRAMVGH